MPPWHVIALFCEDIREEKHGSSTLLGLFPDNMEVSQFPGMMPKLGIYVRIHTDTAADIGSIALRLRFPDGKETALGSFDADFVKKQQQATIAQGGTITGLMVNAIAQGLTLQGEGRLVVIANIGGEEVVCGGLNIRLGAQTNPSAIASERPASQSQPVS